MAESKKIEEARKLATKAQTKKKQIKEEKETSIVPNKLGVTEEFVIGGNSKHKYTLKLRYPGSATALGIIDDCRDGNGGVYASSMISDAIEGEVVEEPKELIENGLAFFDNHDGAMEVAGNISKFLGEKLL